MGKLHPKKVKKGEGYTHQDPMTYRYKGPDCVKDLIADLKKKDLKKKPEEK